uniref:Putative terminase n=1 Tax=viral metagenome TaxID=1070528 RepID=A0A6M3L7W3_9ZZZZ
MIGYVVVLAMIVFGYSRDGCGALERAAYGRFERDLERLTEFEYDEGEAARAVAAFERGMCFGKNEWAGRPFLLENWQRFIVSQLFGWYRGDGTRRFRTAYVEVPRKNGKSELAAGLGLRMLLLDGEPTPEVYSAATARDQARIVYTRARNILQLSRPLNRLAVANRSAITSDFNGGVFQPLASDHNSLEGLNIHCAIVDELHAHRTRDVWDVLVSACGSRRQPLIFAITTAGVGRHGICWEMHEHAERVLTGTVEDESFFAYIAAADSDADWTAPSSWRAANPNLGVSLSESYLAGECRRAQAMTGYQNTFRRYFLNQWTEQVDRWLDMEKWRACANPATEEQLAGRDCYLGVDLSRVIDLTAMSAVFPPFETDPLWRVKTWAWAPQERILTRSAVDNVPYADWARDGYLTATPGNRVDYEFVTAAIKGCIERYNVREIGFDEWNATKWHTDLVAAGVQNLVGVPQRPRYLNAPCKELEGLVMQEKIGHDDNPVLNWCAGNVAIRIDANENIAPDKARSTERIDCVSALVTAMARALVHVQEEKAFSSSGILFL